MRKPYMSGWCQSGNHHICPHELRKHRFTPKGTELRQLICPCKCHQEKKSDVQGHPAREVRARLHDTPLPGQERV